MRKLHSVFPCLFVVALLVGFVPSAGMSADTNELWLAEHYTKYEHRIPMRDGIHLFTRVYVPKNDSERWPILLTRAPYALKPYGDDNYNSPGARSSFRPNGFGVASRRKLMRFGLPRSTGLFSRLVG
jgi:uncharacterized protein